MFHAHSTAYQSYPQNHWVSGWVWMVLIPSPEDKIHTKDPQNGDGQVMNRSKVALGWYRVGERAGIRSGAVISHDMNDNLQLSTCKFVVLKLFLFFHEDSRTRLLQRDMVSTKTKSGQKER